MVLLYHGVPRCALAVGDLDIAAFEEQIRHLASEFHCVALASVRDTRARSARPQVHLTFDDGFKNNFTCVAPVLRKLGVPATFFVCSRPTERGRYLWFVYLRVMEVRFPGEQFEFRGRTIDMRPGVRSASMASLTQTLLALKPHPEALYEAIAELPQPESFLSQEELADWCAGMEEGELAQLDADPLFEVEMHTLDHPFLSKCDAQTQREQISRHRTHLENVCGRRCAALAYPIGDYDERTLSLADEFQLDWAFAVNSPGRGDSRFEIPRLGIYSASAGVLSMKSLWGNHIRALRIRVG